MLLNKYSASLVLIALLDICLSRLWIVKIQKYNFHLRHVTLRYLDCICNAHANSEKDETIQLALYFKPLRFWPLIIAPCLKTLFISIPRMQLEAVSGRRGKCI